MSSWILVGFLPAAPQRGLACGFYIRRDRTDPLVVRERDDCASTRLRDLPPSDPGTASARRPSDVKEKNDPRRGQRAHRRAADRNVYDAGEKLASSCVPSRNRPPGAAPC